MYEVYSAFFNVSTTRFEYNFIDSENKFNWDQDFFEKSVKEIKPKLIFLANPDSPTDPILTKIIYAMYFHWQIE